MHLATDLLGGADLTLVEALSDSLSKHVPLVGIAIRLPFVSAASFVRCHRGEFL